MMAQAAKIFPKNIHIVGSLMDRVASNLYLKREGGGRRGVHVCVCIGELYYLATTLVLVQED